MEVKYVAVVFFMQLIALLSVAPVAQEFDDEETIEGNNHRGCAFIHCEGTEVCVFRKFRCPEPPCPGMLYCAKSRSESIRGPSSCDTVHCTTGYICTLIVRGCHWGDRCERQVARCVSRKMYYEGPASCAGFKCPLGHHCILRESFCADPPCKLIGSCPKNSEVYDWFRECQALGCPSEYECFLRSPGINCKNRPCIHTPDCIREKEVQNERCRGWVCPQRHICFAETERFCESNDCDIRRTCQLMPMFASNNSLPTSGRFFKEEEDILEDKTEVSEEISVEEIEVETTTITQIISTTERFKARDTTEAFKTRTTTEAFKARDTTEPQQSTTEKNTKQQNDEKFENWKQSMREMLESDMSQDRREEFVKMLQTMLGAEGQLSLEKKPMFTTTENLYTTHHTELPTVETTHQQPMKNTTELPSSSPPIRDSGLGNLSGVISQLQKELPKPNDFTFPNGLEEWTYVLITLQKMLSVCTEVLENTEHKLLPKKTNVDNNSAALLELLNLLDETDDINAILIHLVQQLDECLKKCAKNSVQLNMNNQQFDHQYYNDSPETSQNQPNNENSKESLTSHLHDEENLNEFPFEKDHIENLSESPFQNDHIKGSNEPPFENDHIEIKEKDLLRLLKMHGIQLEDLDYVEPFTDIVKLEIPNTDAPLEEATEKPHKLKELNIFIHAHRNANPFPANNHFLEANQEFEHNIDDNLKHEFLAYDTPYDVGISKYFPFQLQSSTKSLDVHAENDQYNFNAENREKPATAP